MRGPITDLIMSLMEEITPDSPEATVRVTREVWGMLARECPQSAQVTDDAQSIIVQTGQCRIEFRLKRFCGCCNQRLP